PRTHVSLYEAVATCASCHKRSLIGWREGRRSRYSWVRAFCAALHCLTAGSSQFSSHWYSSTIFVWWSSSVIGRLGVAGGAATEGAWARARRLSRKTATAVRSAILIVISSQSSHGKARGIFFASRHETSPRRRRTTSSA